MDLIDRRIRMETVTNSEVKLTKAGLTYSTASLKKIEKLISNDSKINFNELIGVAVNPNLTGEMIRSIFGKLLSSAKSEKDNTSIPQNTKTKNMGLRSKIRKLLSEHPNLDNDAITSLLLNNSKTSVLNNSSITEEHLNLFFEKRVLDKKKGEYSFLEFERLSKAKNVTQTIMKKWYNELLKFADWTYSDNQWYSIITSVIMFDDLHIEAINTIASTPKNNESNNWAMEYNRELAVDHKNATEETKLLAFEATHADKYLPKDVIDIFLF